MKIQSEFKKGILFSAIGKYSNVLIQLGVTAVLSRILTPLEYGVVAVVNVFLIFFTMLTDVGIGPAVIQNKSLEKKDINSIFSFSLLLSLCLGILFLILAKPISIFYHNPVYTKVCSVLAISIFTTGIIVIPQSLMLKNKDFFEVNMTIVIANAISGVAAIIMAINHFSYYSLLFSYIIKNVIVFFVFYNKVEVKVPLKISLTPLKSIYEFSRNQFMFSFINYFSRNLDNILIGKIISPNALAYYDKAYQLSLYPNQLLTSVIGPVIQPIMSDYQNDRSVIKNVYLKISKILGTIGMPLTVFLFFSANEIIYIMFGNQWAGSVGTFKVLGVSIWIQIILSSTGAIFQSANRTDLLLKAGIFSSILNVSSIIAGIISGRIEYVALVLVISFLVNFIQANYLLMRVLFESKMREFYKVLYKPFLISLVMIAVFFIFSYFHINNIYLSFVIKLFIYLLVFILGLVVTGELKELKKIILNN
ncbi:lipopolysaccharide biosynthesis protein [Bacillus sp. UNCCL81]|uniref:lipopolysaccharide biosynthesis protein n=1 Tax=Bacillus sp. UNCCL81 TaxID=1502755 RepID=UPI0008F0D78A|nr:lipopolysaccharide biosynthesis protein [Bacillus sp. UNCCL81]SFD10169.1 polysaccharide transporter, PST family [Bacillus sp. UNCCL81]